MNKKIIIIGGVAAGMSAASKAKRIDKSLDITVYEMTDAISWGACGLPYYVGDFYSDSSVMVARTYEEFQKEGINVKIKHKVENIDFINKKIFVRNLNENKVFEDNYDELVIATGASSTSPRDIKNLDAEGVYHLKTFNEGLEVKKEMMKIMKLDIKVLMSEKEIKEISDNIENGFELIKYNNDYNQFSIENKEKLTALLAQQVEVKKALEEVEMDWLAAQEELEAMLQA